MNTTKKLKQTAANADPRRVSCRDRLGNGYDETNQLIEPYAGTTPIDDQHFWCIVCQDVKPVALGAIASKEIGGWECRSHS
jgi:hypothetical protein